MTKYIGNKYGKLVVVKFYDFEVFKEDWLVVVIDTTAGVTLTFEPAYVSKPAVVTQINDVNLTSIVSDVNESSVHVRLETVDGVAATGTVEVIAHGF